jgi:uncharacterized protein YecT (DUF1311 family)
LVWIALVLLFVAAGSAQQPAESKAAVLDKETPCNQSGNQAELNQCAAEQYHKADVRLNAVYRKVLESLQKDLTEAQRHHDADQAKWIQAAITKLKGAERAWTEYRNLHCDAARHQYEGGSMSIMVETFCMEKTTHDRIEELKQAYENGDRKLE